jgi:hypothetical protein
MSKVKPSEFHKMSYAHHDTAAMGHREMMGHHREGTPEHAFHRAQHESHTTMRDFHKSCMEKALDDEMNKVVPTQVSAVAPDRPGRLVNRPGSPMIEKRVTEEAADIIGISATSMHSEERSLQ